jgi:hypothetical protein
MTERANLARSLSDEKPITWLFKFKNLSFDFERRRYIQFHNLEYSNGEVLRKFLQIPKKLWYKIQDNGSVGFYEEKNREVTTELSFDDVDARFTNKQEGILETARAIFRELMNKALKSLEDYYSDLCSDEYAIEDMKSDNWKFLEDGSRYD